MPSADSTGPRVLLVDDDAAVAKAMAAVLSKAGYRVTPVGNPREAEQLLDERFDLLVLDLRMPTMRGDAFYYLARARQPWLGDRTLFITGDITEQAETIVHQTGCALMHKPFNVEALLRAIQPFAPLAGRTIDRAG